VGAHEDLWLRQGLCHFELLQLASAPVGDLQGMKAQKTPVVDFLLHIEVGHSNTVG
jgi:hypothetical protein